MHQNPEIRKRRRKISLIPLSLMLVGGFFLWTIFSPISEDFDHLFFEKTSINTPDSFVLKLHRNKDFVLVEQTNKNSSGFAVISMTSSLMGKPVSQKAVMDKFEKNGKRGMFPSSFIYYLRAFLPGYNILLIHPDNDTELKGVFIHQLKQNIPVPVLISTTNYLTKKDRININYSLIIGYDKKQDLVTIATTFGFIEQVPFKELKSRLDHTNYKKIPLLLGIAIRLGMYNINNIFLIESKKEDNQIL